MTTVPNFRSYRLTEENFNRYKAMLNSGMSSWRLSQEHSVPISTANRITRASNFADYTKLLEEARQARYENQRKAALRANSNQPKTHWVDQRTTSPFTEQSNRTYTEVTSNTILPDIQVDGKPANAPTSNQVNSIDATLSNNPEDTVGLRYVKKGVGVLSPIKPGSSDPRIESDTPYMPFWPLPVNGGQPLTNYQDGSVVHKRITYTELQEVLRRVKATKSGVTTVLRELKCCPKQTYRQILFLTNPTWLKEFDDVLEAVRPEVSKRSQKNIDIYTRKQQTATIYNPRSITDRQKLAEMKSEAPVVVTTPEVPKEPVVLSPVEEPAKEETVSEPATEPETITETITMTFDEDALKDKNDDSKAVERSRWPLRVNWALIGAQICLLIEQFVFHAIDLAWYMLFLPALGVVAFLVILDIALAWRVIWWAVNGRDVNQELKKRGIIKK